MKRSSLILAFAALLIAGPILAGKASRWAGRGAAGGAIAGLLLGGDLGSAAEGAALGAAGGAIGGAISDSSQKKKAKRQAEAEAQAEAEVQAEQQAAKANKSQLPAGLPQNEDEWIAAIGEDNVNALDALVDCQHDRARLLAQASGTSDDSEYRLLGVWLQALVALDQKDQTTAEEYFARIIPLDDHVDTVQQAGLVADQAILEIRNTRDNEGISCGR